MANKKQTRVERWWLKLAGSWGAKLADEYGVTAPEDWADRINRTDDERLQKALTEMRTRHPNWPPTLGQFEAAIPKRELTNAPSNVDRLAAAAAADKTLCEHQRMTPWTYFGRQEDREIETRGVVVPSCTPCNRPSHRIRAIDL